MPKIIKIYLRYSWLSATSLTLKDESDSQTWQKSCAFWQKWVLKIFNFDSTNLPKVAISWSKRFNSYAINTGKNSTNKVVTSSSFRHKIGVPSYYFKYNIWKSLIIDREAPTLIQSWFLFFIWVKQLLEGN